MQKLLKKNPIDTELIKYKFSGTQGLPYGRCFKLSLDKQTMKSLIHGILARIENAIKRTRYMSIICRNSFNSLCLRIK